MKRLYARLIQSVRFVDGDYREDDHCPSPSGNSAALMAALLPGHSTQYVSDGDRGPGKSGLCVAHGW